MSAAIVSREMRQQVRLGEGCLMSAEFSLLNSLDLAKLKTINTDTHACHIKLGMITSITSSEKLAW